jgi:hypothetical protein
MLRSAFIPRKITRNIKLNFKETGTESILFRIMINEAGFCGNGNAHSSCIQVGKISDELSDYQLLWKDFLL